MTIIHVDKIIRNAKGDKPGLADIHYEDDCFCCPMTVEFYSSLPKDERSLDVDIILYSYNDYEVYKDEEEFINKKDNSMAPESIIPIGNFQIESGVFKKSSENFINGKVLSVRENDEYYEVELQCLNVIYYAYYHVGFGPKPEVGNIISSVYWTEIVVNDNSANQSRYS